MDIRDKILAAATQVYAEGGFQGATTRRVAELAGVNEVTIFRQFGSKDALMDQVMASIIARVNATEHPLPAVPVQPADELAKWAVSFHTLLAAHAPILRKAVGTVDKRRKDAIDALTSTDTCEDQLRVYVDALRAHGFIDPEVASRPDADEFVGAAAAMLMNTVWGDAMWRDLAPHWVFPLPPTGAVRCYVDVFVRAIGLETRAAAATSVQSPPFRVVVIRRFLPATLRTGAALASSSQGCSRRRPGWPRAR